MLKIDAEMIEKVAHLETYAEKKDVLKTDLGGRLNPTPISMAIKTYFDEPAEFVSYTLEEIINLQIQSKIPNAKVVLALSQNQRIFVKTIEDMKVYFYYTFNGLPLPSIQIAKQRKEFFKLHKFDGYQFDDQIISSTENSTSVNRKPIKVYSDTEEIDLVIDGQQRLSMAGTSYNGSFNGLTAHFNLDNFIIEDGKVLATPFSMEFHNMKSEEYQVMMNSKKDIEFLTDKTIDRILNKGETYFTFYNIIPAHAIQMWKNMSVPEIIEDIKAEYNVIVTDDNIDSVTNIIAKLKEFYYGYKIITFAKKPNMSHDDIKLVFDISNMRQTKVTQAEVVTGHFVDGLGYDMEQVISSLSKYFLYLGVKDVRSARDFSMRAIMTLMNWDTSFNGTLKVIDTDYDKIKEKFGELKKNLSIITQAIIVSRAEITTSNGVTSDLNLNLKNTTGVMDDEELALFGTKIFYLAFKQLKDGKKYLGKMTTEDRNFAFDIMNIRAPLVQQFKSEKSKRYSQLRDFVNVLIANGGLTAKNMEIAAKSIGFSFELPIDASSALKNDSDIHRNTLAIFGKDYVSYGKAVMPVVFDENQFDIEHIASKENWRTKEKYKKTLVAEGVTFTDAELTDMKKFMVDFGDSLINKMILVFSINRNFGNIRLSEKFFKVDPSKQADYLNQMGLGEVYKKNPLSVLTIIKAGNEIMLMFLKYYNEVRYRESHNKKWNEMIDPAYVAQVEKSIDDIYKTFYLKVMMDEDGQMKYPAIKGKMDLAFNTIKAFL